MKSLFKSHAFVGLFMFMLPGLLIAQEIEVNIADEGTTNTDSCVEYLVLTDSNADDGNYEAGESYEATLCFNTIEGDIAQVAILPTDPATGNVWDVDGNSSLFIYEGTGTAGTLLGEFNSVSDPDGVFFTTDVACLTFVFISGEDSSGEGFYAEFKCVEPKQPFNMVVDALDPTEYSDQDFEGLQPTDSVVTICYQDSISFQVNLDFPLSDATGNGYEQSLETTNIIWDWGDGTTPDEGMGLAVNGHIYQPFGGFLLTIIAEDEQGQREITRINVLVSPRPVFSGILFDDTLCVGESTQLTGGILLEDTVGIDRSTGSINIYLDSTDSLALPDGDGTFYTTGINISNYANDPVISGPEDFVGICLNMEHSYLGDLEAWLTCPDGSTALLFDGYNGEGQYPGQGFGGGTTFLGSPEDGFPVLADSMGIGWDYCFSDDADILGTMAEEHAAGNTTAAELTPGQSMVPGTYLPEEAFFEAFEGCPVNGPWELTIGDNIGADNGFIFSWNIEFNSEFYIDTVYYSPTIVDAYWEDNPDIVANNDTIVTVIPSTPGNNSFTFIAEDSFGCIHDTTFTVYVRPPVSIDDAIACDLTHTLAPSNAVDAAWAIIDTPSPESVVAWEQVNGATYNIVVNEYGLYEFQIEEGPETCGYVDTAIIDFRPDPQVAPLVSDTTLCVGATITLDAGPQEANSDNFSVLWTRDGSGVANDTYTYTADQTGVHVVNITGVCGSASDTTNLVAISIQFEGNTFCGLQIPASVEVNPEGTGFWSADSEDISFSNANLQFTQISSLNYGEYEITYTDDRCVNDGVSRTFRFVDAPTVIVEPEELDFCVDEDQVIVWATVEGSNTGDFLWSVNGEPQATTNDTLIFPVNYFEPTVLNDVVATANDPFGVCPQGSGSTAFIGDWCNYNIPNVVTPNEDSRNDRFHVEYLELIPGARLTIFDRWGTIVFEHSDYGQYQLDNPNRDGVQGGWDPTDAGTGTYYYELVMPTAESIETGYFQVLIGDTN